MDDRWESEVIEYGAINITGFRIVDTSKKYVKEFLDGWKRLDPTTSQGAGKELISAQAALMYDAVFVLVEAFSKIMRKKPDQFRAYTMRNRGQPFNLPANGTRTLDCNTSKGWVTPWEHGDKISRYLRKVSTVHVFVFLPIWSKGRAVRDDFRSFIYKLSYLIFNFISYTFLGNVKLCLTCFFIL